MQVDLVRFGLVIEPEKITMPLSASEIAASPDPAHPQHRVADGLIETNGSVRLSPEIALALAGEEKPVPVGVFKIGTSYSVTLRFDMFFTASYPRTDENDILRAWDMKFRGAGKVDCDIGRVEVEKLEKNDV